MMDSPEKFLRPIYQRIYEHAKPYLRTLQNLIHTRIVLRYALKLLREEKGSEEVVIPAFLLHDVGWNTVPEHLHLTAFGPNLSNRELAMVHEVEGRKIAKKMLESLHCPPEKAKEICQIIRGHNTRNRSISRNDRIVKEADKLFRYSRKGLAIDLHRFRMPRRKYLFYLRGMIDQWFLTPTGRKSQRKRFFCERGICQYEKACPTFESSGVWNETFSLN